MVDESMVSINFTWTRPNNVPYPNVWHEFEIKSKNGQQMCVKIEDVPPDRFEEFLDFMAENFDRYQPIVRGLEATSNPEFVKTSRIIRQKILDQKICLIATIKPNNDEDAKSSKIIGGQTLLVASKYDPPFQVSEDNWKKIIGLVNSLKENIDPFELLQSDNYIQGFGVAIEPGFYRFGIATQFQLCFLRMGKIWNIGGSLTTFSSIDSQKMAEKNGWKLLKEIRFDEYKDSNGKVVIPTVTETQSTKFMIFKIT